MLSRRGLGWDLDLLFGGVAWNNSEESCLEVGWELRKCRC